MELSSVKGCGGVGCRCVPVGKADVRVQKQLWDNVGVSGGGDMEWTYL